MLDYNSIKAGKFKPFIGKITIEDAVHQIIKIVQLQADLVNNKIKVKFDKLLPEVIYSDFKRLQ